MKGGRTSRHRRRGPPDGRSDRLTIAEFAALPDDEMRLELVRGRMVREPPAGARHGASGMSLGARLHDFVSRNGLGVVLGAETGFILDREAPTVRAPDVAFLSKERIPAEGLPRGFFDGAPDLAIEIASPSNTRAELREKAADYLAAGGRKVWIVDLEGRWIEVHRPGARPVILRENEVLDGGEVLPGWRVRVGEVG